MTLLILLVTTFLATYTGVELFRRWSLRHEIIDIPNERSSHQRPTPRGGGLVIVLITLLFYLIYTVFIGGGFSIGYFLGAVLVAIVSWFDDLKSLSPALRFFVHALAAGLAVYTIGYWQELMIPSIGSINLKSIGAAFTMIWIIWLTNAYNFMDGIDGIAATQALTAGVGWYLVGSYLGADFLRLFGGVIAANSLGFLLHNWQPAKIFMGDVGSAFLGYTFAVLPLMAEAHIRQNKNLLALTAILFVWLFVFDTVLTFCRRLLRGEKVWQAHRTHLYQRLVRSGYSHRRVTSLYGLLSAVNLVLGLLLIRNNGNNVLYIIPTVFAFSFGVFLLSEHRKRVNQN
jgi:Fuc2NAc and GlcNAc transferase